MTHLSPQNAYTLLHPQTGYGKMYENKYHNIGQLTPNYHSRYHGVGGGYGPVQASAERYTLQNPVSVYPPDQQMNPLVYLPSRGQLYANKEGIFPSIETQYPELYHPQKQQSFFGRNVKEQPPHRCRSIAHYKQ